MSRRAGQAIGISLAYTALVVCFFVNPCISVLLLAVLSIFLISRFKVFDDPSAPTIEPWFPSYLCEKCDYDIRGVTTGRCPECGTVITHRFESVQSAAVPDR